MPMRPARPAACPVGRCWVPPPAFSPRPFSAWRASFRWSASAGASLVQLYTALVFKGPGLIGAIKRGLLAALAAEGLTLAQAVGRDVHAVQG